MDMCYDGMKYFVLYLSLSTLYRILNIYYGHLFVSGFSPIKILNYLLCVILKFNCIVSILINNDAEDY